MIEILLCSAVFLAGLGTGWVLGIREGLICAMEAHDRIRAEHGLPPRDWVAEGAVFGSAAVKRSARSRSAGRSLATAKKEQVK